MEHTSPDFNAASYGIFIRSQLIEDLKFAYECREKLKQETIELADLKHSIDLLLNSPDIEANGLQSTLNIGCDFFVDASVKDMSKILLNIGANVFIECTLKEALTFIEKKQKLLEHQIEYMTTKIAQIKGYISLYTSTISLNDPSSPIVDFDALDVSDISVLHVPNTSCSATEIVQKSLLNTLKSLSS